MKRNYWCISEYSRNIYFTCWLLSRVMLSLNIIKCRFIFFGEETYHAFSYNKNCNNQPKTICTHRKWKLFRYHITPQNIGLSIVSGIYKHGMFTKIVYPRDQLYNFIIIFFTIWLEFSIIIFLIKWHIGDTLGEQSNHQ